MSSDESEDQLIQSIVAQVKKDQSEANGNDDAEVDADVPLGNVSVSASPVLPVAYRAPPAPRPVKPAADWKDMLSLGVLKPISIFSLLLFVLYQPMVIDLIKSIIPDSLGVVGGFLPLVVLSLLASTLITLINHLQLI